MCFKSFNFYLFTSQSYTTSSLNDYLRNKEGKKQFLQDTSGSPATLTVQQRDCDEDAGCVCGNDQYPVCVNTVFFEKCYVTISLF